MKFKFIISKWANFYFFIQNLSEWHPRNRKDYNNLWQAEFGLFSKREKEMLRIFKEIRLRYKSIRSEFDRAFFTSKEPLKELQKNLQADEFIKIKTVFILFKKKFNYLYEKDLLLLKRWQKILNKTANAKSLMKLMINPIEILYNAPAPKKTINTYLLFSTTAHTGGGANIDEQSISIEISRYPIQGVNHAIGIIWHEIIHLCFERHYFIPLLIEYFGRTSKHINLVSEIAASSLLPNGILGQNILHVPSPKLLNTRIPAKFNNKLLNIMKDNIQHKKHLDKKYIKNVWAIIKSSQNVS